MKVPVAQKPAQVTYIGRDPDGLPKPSIKLKVGEKCSCIAPGQYKAFVRNITVEQKYKKDTLVFLFEIAEGPHKGVQCNGYCNANYVSFTSNTKLYKWYVPAAGEEPTPGSDFDLDVFYDKLFLVEVKTKEARKTGNLFSNVVQILEHCDDI
jgi:hypothetical protein